MKKITFISLLLTISNAFAFEVNLAEQGRMTVSYLSEIGAESVTCSLIEPKCILKGNKFGVQYPSEKLEDVELSEATDPETAIILVKKLKRGGFCK